MFLQKIYMEIIIHYMRLRLLKQRHRKNALLLNSIYLKYFKGKNRPIKEIIFKEILSYTILECQEILHMMSKI